MKYSNALSLLYALILTITSASLYGQCGTNCSVACNGQINVSLGKNCETLFTPDMGGKNITSSNVQCYTAEVYDLYNNPIESNLLTLDHLGQTLTYKITETECNNYCWGSLLVEYKLGPQIVCPDDMTISCSALDYLELPVPQGLCAAVTMNMTSERYENLSCDPDHQSKVIRTYRAVDEFGNTTTCSHNVYLERIPLDEVIFPANTKISCSDTYVQYDANGFPLPYVFQSLTDSLSHYSVPFLCQQDVVTDLKCPIEGAYGSGGTGSGTGSGAGYVYPGPSDYYGLPLFPDDGGRIVYETGDTLEPIKIIDVNNAKTSHYCGAAVVYTDTELPRTKTTCTRKIFRNWQVLEWWCSEELNVSSLQIIEIVDDVAPTIACPSDITVNSTSDCLAEVVMPSAAIADACNPDLDVVMTYADKSVDGNGGLVVLESGSDTLTYTVSDLCGNAASCQMAYTVIDYATPIAICEDQKVVSLVSGDFTKVPATVFDNGSYDNCSIVKTEVRRLGSSCDSLANEWTDYAYFCCEDAATPSVSLEFRVTDASGNFGACQVEVVVQDKLVPDLSCPPNVTIDCHTTYDVDNMSNVFGAGYVANGCNLESPYEVISSDVDLCGAGTIVRTLQALSSTGDVIASCDQLITIENNDPVTADNIVWPADLMLSDRCAAVGLEPENLDAIHGYPQHPLTSCAQIGYDYEDEIFTYSTQGNGTCTTIARTWTAINWCSATGSFDTYVIPYPQLITISNATAPEMDDQGPVEFATINDCASGNIDITRTATDDCSDNLIWSYEIRDYFTGDTLAYGLGNQLTGKFPVGDYFVNWTVRDNCGNATTDKQQVKVSSAKAPTAVCHNALAVKLGMMDLDNDGIEETDMVTLWASDFDAGSYPACNTELAFSLSTDLTDRNIIFDCSHLGEQRVELWVTDIVSGAQDFCIATIEIQDNGRCIEGQRAAVVSGHVRTETNANVYGVEVALRGATEISQTDLTGNYAFSDMPLGGNYALVPSLDSDYLNGVSTLDLIRIQRHILGVEALDSPYKLIAADVNSSGNINGIDLVELRKLILGIYTELPNNSSWRFVSAEYNFLDPMNPWSENWDQDYFIPELNSDMEIDFVGVKIGDTNNSVTTSGAISSPMPFAPIDLTSTHSAIEVGEVETIVFSAEQYARIIGMQGTLNFDNSSFEVLTADIVSESEDLVGDFIIDNDAANVAFSFNLATSDLSFESKNLFELSIRAKTSIDAGAQLFSVSSDVTPAEVYSNELDALPLSIDQTDRIASAEIRSVNPNPWISEGVIAINATKPMDCQLEYYDVNGRLLYNESTTLGRGMNNVTISKQEIKHSGIVIVRMISQGEISEYRMIVF